VCVCTEQIECLHDADFIYAVLPFCNGGELFSVVESGGAMDERECRHWFTQVIAGLSYLQSRYICHRDMSLENVLLDGDISKVRAQPSATADLPLMRMLTRRAVSWRRRSLTLA
jgi:serine/threonine protein kinase